MNVGVSKSGYKTRSAAESEQTTSSVKEVLDKLKLVADGVRVTSSAVNSSSVATLRCVYKAYCNCSFLCRGTESSGHGHDINVHASHDVLASGC